jgi:hypothetical protein
MSVSIEEGEIRGKRLTAATQPKPEISISGKWLLWLLSLLFFSFLKVDICSYIERGRRRRRD